MTDEEIIKEIENIRRFNYTLAPDEVFDRAISTLKKNKGEWIAQDIHNCHTNFKCSECGYIHSFMHLYGEPTADYTYCPSCGARMKGGE